MDFLGRQKFDKDTTLWPIIDEIVVRVAQTFLNARKIIEIDGPYGLSLQHFGSDEIMLSEPTDKAILNMSYVKSTPLVLLYSPFVLTSRELDVFVSQGIRPTFKSLVEAVRTIAQKEDNLIFNGSSDIGLTGIFTNPDSPSIKLKNWDTIGNAFNSIIEAVEKLDNAGFHGPYGLVLNPSLYNKIFRKYPDSELTEINHIQTLVTGGIIKGTNLKTDGALVQVGKEFLSIVIGQDLSAGFETILDRSYKFSLSESIALKITDPEAICILKT